MPGDVSLKGIEFEIKGKSDAASSSIDKLIGKLGALQKALSATSGIQKLSSGLKGLQEAMQNLKNADIKGASEALTEFGKTAKSLEGLAAMSKDLSTFAKSMVKLAENPEGILNVAEALNTLGSVDLTNLVQAQEALRAFADAMKAVNSGGGRGAPQEKQISLWHRLAEGVRSVAKAGAQGAFQLLAKPFRAGFGDVARFAKPIGGVVSKFKRIVGYRIIRSIIREITQGFSEGIKNLYGWSTLVGGKFAASMNQITTSMTYFKNSIGAAVAPIINALAPAIDFLIDKVVALINVINQLFARLTGAATWTRAIKKAQEYDDAIAGAGGSAKEALRYLAPFDELNRLPSDKARGGGGSNQTDYSGMFEDVSVFAEGVSNFADNIRAAVENGDWQGVGKLIGEKVNGIIDSINFSAIGTKVGEKINALFTTEYWTLKSINFQNIGKKVAEFLTGDDGIGGALRQIDFSNIGGVLAEKTMIIPEILIGAINQLDFGAVAKSLGDFFRGTIDGFSESIESIDWKATVKNFVQGFVDTIKGFDITGALNSVGNLFSQLAGAVSQVDWGEAVRTLTKGLIEAIANIDITNLVNGTLELAGAVIGAVIEGLGSLLVDIAEVITDPNTWKLVWAWMQDIPAKVKQFGIDVVNKFVAPIVDGINKLIESYNGSALAEMFGKIPPISFNLIPDIPESELTKNYDAAKKQLEAESQAKKAQLSATANYVSSSNKLTPGQRTIPAFAEYLSVKSKLTAGQRTIPAFANYVSSNDRLNDAQRTIPTIANYQTANDKLSAEQKTLPGTVKFSQWSNSLPSTPWAYGKEYFNAWSNSLPNTPWAYGTEYFNAWENYGIDPWSWATIWFNKYAINGNLKDKEGDFVVEGKLKVVGQSGTPTINAKISPNVNVAEYKAGGGVFSGGAWHDIPQFASGTTRAGSLFIAGEAGPEVVGHIGGRTEVLNKSQMAATMYSAVRSALHGLRMSVSAPSVVSANDGGVSEETMYRAFSRALADSDLGNDIELDGEVLYTAMVNRNRRNTRLTGVNAMA